MDEQTAASEPLDVFDSQFQHVGTLPRNAVHERGLWHQTFHCWFVRKTSAGTTLFVQKRHMDKQANPGKFDVTVAGHLLAGESPIHGLREIEEELGVSVQSDGVSYVATLPIVQAFGPTAPVGDTTPLMDREFCHVFLYTGSEALTDFQPALDEVTGVYEITWKDWVLLQESPSATRAIAGYRYHEAGSERHETTVVGEDLVQRTPGYIDLLAQAIERISGSSLI